MPAPTETQRRLVQPIDNSWVTDLNPIYGTEVPARVQITEIVNRRYLPIFLTAAEALTRVGLGPFSYEIAEQQKHPEEDRPLVKSHVVLNYVGLEDRKVLAGIIHRAKEIYWRMKHKGVSDEDIERKVALATATLAELEPGRIETERDAYEMGMLERHAPRGSSYHENRFFAMHFKAVDYRHRRKLRLREFYS